MRVLKTLWVLCLLFFLMTGTSSRSEDIPAGDIPAKKIEIRRSGSKTYDNVRRLSFYADGKHLNKLKKIASKTEKLKGVLAVSISSIENRLYFVLKYSPDFFCSEDFLKRIASAKIVIQEKIDFDISPVRSLAQKL